jgi:hypothetical protein
VGTLFLVQESTPVLSVYAWLDGRPLSDSCSERLHTSHVKSIDLPKAADALAVNRCQLREIISYFLLPAALAGLLSLHHACQITYGPRDGDDLQERQGAHERWGLPPL